MSTGQRLNSMVHSFALPMWGPADLSQIMANADKGHCGGKKNNRRLGKKYVYSDYSVRAFKFITLLREPVDRVVSEFFWWRSKMKMNERAWDQPLHTAARESLMAWVSSPHNNAHNRMTKQLAFFPSMRAPGRANRQCTSYGAAEEKEFWSALYNRSVDEALWATVNQDDVLLENAIHSLSDRFAAIAITERMGDSLTVVCNAVVREGRPWDSMCGSPIIQGAVGEKAAHLHKNGHRSATEEERLRIRQLNRLDLELYDFAVDRLDEQLALGRGR
ncbi:unnamed protein product [Prorocentrum cordatum]|uniref:Sulfotransferase family protein n=1 Tax=Prorocentrum cordatum TaxID=2364126 RepID=A0ABN9SM85_9DINO|nr:unnamed protein product [Polarella glacialis]